MTCHMVQPKAVMSSRLFKMLGGRLAAKLTDVKKKKG